MQDLRIIIAGVVMLFVSAFLMAEQSQAASSSVSIANEAPVTTVLEHKVSGRRVVARVAGSGCPSVSSSSQQPNPRGLQRRAYPESIGGGRLQKRSPHEDPGSILRSVVAVDLPRVQ